MLIYIDLQQGIFSLRRARGLLGWVWQFYIAKNDKEEYTKGILYHRIPTIELVIRSLKDGMKT